MKPSLGSKQLAIAVIGILASITEVKADNFILPVTGKVLGTVVDTAGIPQMGASVQLLNRYQRSVAHTLTNVDGRFAFASLAPDTYSVQVSLASFLPAMRDRILVRVGFDSVLSIHLANLLSKVEVSYQVPNGAISDDWKWILRSSSATRPINRLVSADPPTEDAKFHPRVFSGTHAMLSVSGRDGGLIDSDEIGADMGTSFAVSTNVFGNNQLQLAGTVGQNAVFGPAALALCAIYSRTDDSPFATPPEITLTVAQLGGVGPALSVGAPNGSVTAGPPILRAMSLGVYQVADPLDNVHIEYGVTGESVEYGQHTSRLSPFARITVNIGSASSIVAAYSDGGRPNDLTAHQQFEEAKVDGQGGELAEPLENVSRLPEISNRNGRLELERTQSLELGVNKTVGSRTFSVSGFSEKVWNGRLNVAGDLSAVEPGNLFSDGVSATSIYNLGQFDRIGYVASLNQRVNNSFDVGIGYGRMGGFIADPAGFHGPQWSTSTFLDPKQSNIASLSLKATVPRVGTRISANYGWLNNQTVIPIHVFTTQDVNSLPGFNIMVRQPLPSFLGMPGHFELTADLRNLSADGYTPVNIGEGHQLLLVECPRAIRGGLKFIF